MVEGGQKELGLTTLKSIVEGARLTASEFGRTEKVGVNSWHHQSAQRPQTTGKIDR